MKTLIIITILFILTISSCNIYAEDIWGYVRYSDNSSTPMVSVNISKVLCGGEYEHITTAITGDDGRYQAGGLPLGWYLVKPYKEGMFFIPDNQTIELR